MKIRFFVNIHLKIKDFGVGTLSSSYFLPLKRLFVMSVNFFEVGGLYTKYRKVKKRTIN